MVAENIEKIRQRIASVCTRTDRKPEDVTLIAVTKTFGSLEVKGALNCGVIDFGENYVQELRQKQREFAGENVRWHFLGHLQSNKVKYIAPWIHLIHSVDSLNLGKAISRQGAVAGRTIDVLIEVHTSEESTKFGVTPESTREMVRQLSVLPNIRIAGLMTIGPFLPDPESSRPSFRTLRELKSGIERDGFELEHLSMGMTNDFEVAIEEGATMVRIGTAIFGKRTKPTNE